MSLLSVEEIRQLLAALAVTIKGDVACGKDVEEKPSK